MRGPERPQSRQQSGAGATGLERATSGVTVPRRELARVLAGLRWSLVARLSRSWPCRRSPPVAAAAFHERSRTAARRAAVAAAFHTGTTGLERATSGVAVGQGVPRSSRRRLGEARVAMSSPRHRVLASTTWHALAQRSRPSCSLSVSDRCPNASHGRPRTPPSAARVWQAARPLLPPRAPPRPRACRRRLPGRGRGSCEARCPAPAA